MHFTRSKELDMTDLSGKDFTSEPASQFMGLPAVGTSVAKGATFGVSMFVSTAVSARVSALITVAVFGAVWSIRNSLWTRTSVASVLEARLMDAILNLNLGNKIKVDFEDNLDKLKHSIKIATLNELQVMGDRDLKKYYYVLKMGLDYDAVEECLFRIRDQAVLFNQ